MDGIDAGQFLKYVIRPTLHTLDLWCLESEALLLGTALTESGLRYLDQVEAGGDRKPGPALGPYQVEIPTHDDQWASFLVYHKGLYDMVRGLMIRNMPLLDQLHCNLAYATAICRIHYLRVKEKLPALDAKAMAAYHKKYYNSYLGATDPAVSVIHFQKAIDVCYSKI